MTHPLEAVAIVQNLLNGIGWLLSKVYDLVANYALTIVLFTLGRPIQTLIGCGVVALGIPVSYLVLKPQGATIPDVLPGPGTSA